MKNTVTPQNTIVGYLGPEGTFSHQAALKSLKDHICSYTFTAYPTIPQILYAVEKGDAQLGVVPAENSIEGSVNITMDMLAHELSLFIQNEIIMEIKHHLITFMTGLEQIHTVMSHPQALAQCRHFIQQKLGHATLVETKSTADAVHLLGPNKKGLAAIASHDCHFRYQVPILVEDIGDYAHNQTRFLTVSKFPSQSNHTTKTSLVLALEKDRPGGLYDVLSEFAKHNINLTRIESRPAKKELGNYLFFIDCQAGSDHPGFAEILPILQDKTVLLKNIGSYTTWPAACTCQKLHMQNS